jgi:hypothetical protein
MNSLTLAQTNGEIVNLVGSPRRYPRWRSHGEVVFLSRRGSQRGNRHRTRATEFHTLRWWSSGIGATVAAVVLSLLGSSVANGAVTSAGVAPATGNACGSPISSQSFLYVNTCVTTTSRIGPNAAHTTSGPLIFDTKTTTLDGVVLITGGREVRGGDTTQCLARARGAAGDTDSCCGQPSAALNFRSLLRNGATSPWSSRRAVSFRTAVLQTIWDGSLRSAPTPHRLRSV